ncbi:MAG: hypothetical protein OEZ22_05750, partial [Spirochaetia bacterium]|nr:hypothetical protein [Spirochaetia bacterium]
MKTIYQKLFYKVSVKLFALTIPANMQKVIKGKEQLNKYKILIYTLIISLLFSFSACSTPQVIMPKATLLQTGETLLQQEKKAQFGISFLEKSV